MWYRRALIEGATYFFTVNLAERSTRLLVDRVDNLRESVRDVRKAHPFEIVAWVVLPDHLHAVWQLPQNDADYKSSSSTPCAPAWLLTLQTTNRAAIVTMRLRKRTSTSLRIRLTSNLGRMVSPDALPTGAFFAPSWTGRRSTISDSPLTRTNRLAIRGSMLKPKQ
jgi:hypothetical protein